MSLTKSSASFHRMMEEQREREELSFDQYQDEKYWGATAKKPSGDPAMTGPNARARAAGHQPTPPSANTENH